ncbi:hypothetical protein J6590_080863 [Homalodisca vitripennis]|nr:hypothetical protein J6590_080863 [Homalodisca vitripennis]
MERLPHRLIRVAEVGKGVTPNKTSPPLKEEPTSSGTGYGKSRTLTGNEVLSRRQTKHDPPEILRGASLGERGKQKESKTTPQGKPGVISPRTPPQPHQYPEHDQRCHHGRPSDEKRGPSATTSPIRDQPTQHLAARLSTAELTGWALQKTRSPTWKGLAIRPLLNFLLTLSLDCRSLTLTASQVSLTLGVPGTGRRLSRLQRLDKGTEGGRINMT